MAGIIRLASPNRMVDAPTTYSYYSFLYLKGRGFKPIFWLTTPRAKAARVPRGILELPKTESGTKSKHYFLSLRF